MDSQDKNLNQEVQATEAAMAVPAVETVEETTNVETVEETVTETATEATTDNVAPAAEATQTEAEAPRKIYTTREDIIERLKEISHSDDSPSRDEVDMLKAVFYKLHKAEREAQQQAYLEAGGDPEKYVLTADPLEELFKTEMNIIKEKRQKLFLEQEAEKQENLQKKLAIIEKIKGMATSPDEANKSYQEFKTLQQEWKEIKAVPAEKVSELWQSYKHCVEQYYDLLALNNEAREYDFKKNLEIKTRLCEAAENLAKEEDVISAFHQLQELHNQFRETGPVAKELREEIWARFKAASTVINKSHQAHFETLRQQEEENLTKKTSICEKVENINSADNQPKNAAAWEALTKEILALQAEWKTIGFAPQKMNVKIFERFRAACDVFFQAKAQYFQSLKEVFQQNTEKKKALVEKAVALKDSTEWRATADKLMELQREWKAVGMVPKKIGDQLWEEFIGACNTFFDARKAANSGQRNEQKDNLEKKRGIIAQLKELAESTAEGLQAKMQELQAEYQQTGHVPFKEKDKIYEEYHAAIDKIYKKLNSSSARHRLDSFKDSIKGAAEKGGDALLNERTRLMRRYENMKQEIQTYENNLGFLTSASKKGSSLIDEMNRKVERLKDEMNLVKEKIKAIDKENSAQ